jgi:serine/threonine protein kinase
MFSAELKDLIISVLNKNPDARPTASQLLAHKFFSTD